MDWDKNKQQTINALKEYALTVGYEINDKQAHQVFLETARKTGESYVNGNPSSTKEPVGFLNGCR